MPNDYITKADAIKIVMDANLSTAEMVHEANGMVERISNFPAADVAEVVHGEWTRKRIVIDDFSGRCKNVWQCPKCGGYYTKHFPHCPGCGAKMDGGESHAE